MFPSCQQKLKILKCEGAIQPWGNCLPLDTCGDWQKLLPRKAAKHNLTLFESISLFIKAL